MQLHADLVPKSLQSAPKITAVSTQSSHIRTDLQFWTSLIYHTEWRVFNNNTVTLNI